MKYFEGCKTVQDIKSLYRKLAMQFHPDRGGDTATMQMINLEYHEMLKRLDGFVSWDSKGKEHTYHYRADVEQQIIDKINEMLNLRMEDVNIELIGVWVWVYGANTKKYKEDLKKAGCRWHSKRQMWYWHKKSNYRREFSGVPFEMLRQMYGSKVYDSDDSLGLAVK